MATFRADRCKATFTSAAGGNSFPVHGYAPGTFINAEMNKPLNALEVGEDGEGAWMQTRDLSGKVTFTLMQASLSNTDLSGIVANDEDSGTGYGTLQILDLNGTTLIEGTGRFERQANAGFGGQFVPREWVFLAERLKIRHTGITQR